MAERRMLAKKVTDSDDFTELPSSAQALYFHLNQGADDDGFNNQIQIAMFRAHATIDDLKLLMCKNFIIRFESGVIVIKHWRMHNTLRKDRYTPTNFQEEFKLLGIKDNGSYTFIDNNLQPNSELGCHLVAKRLPQVRIGKDSINNKKENKKKKTEDRKDNVPEKNVYGTYKHVKLTDKEYESLKTQYPTKCDSLIDYLDCYIEEKGYKSKSHYLAIKRWVVDAIRGKETPQSYKKNKNSLDETFEAAVSEVFR